MRNKLRALLLVALCVMLFATLCATVGCDKAQQYYKVSFDTDGGTAVGTKTVLANSEIGELPVTSKDGYDFSGWSSQEGGNVDIDEHYVVTKDVTLYAVYDGKQEVFSITYSTGGTAVASTEVKKGDAVGSLPFTDKKGYSFSGWFYDKDLTQPVYADDVLTGDAIFYAGFEELDVDAVLPEYTEVSTSTSDVNYTVYFESDESIDERNLSSFISVSSLYGDVPKTSVTPSGHRKYALSPIGGYKNGGVYKFEIIDERVNFVDLDDAYEGDCLDANGIKTLYVSVDAADEEIVVIKNGVYEMRRSLVTFFTDNNVFVADENTYEKLPFGVGSVVRIVDDNGGEERYVKITETQAVSDKYEYTYADCDSIDDVYENFEISASDIVVTNEKTLPENQDATAAELAAIASALYGSEGTLAITGMLANALNASPTVQAIASASENPYRDNISDVKGKTFKIDGLLEDLTIGVSLGTCKNKSFNGIGISPFDDTRWTMLAITFEYETEIKNKVKLEATITVTQYLFVGLAAAANKSSGDFKAEITPYSQTDIAFQVLVCSASGDDEDDKGDDKGDKKEEKKDISVEIENLVNGDGDSSNIIQDVQEMLENKGDAVELCKVPLFSASYTVGGVVSINFDLNFVIKVSFAAGVKIDATLLEATTIGVTGNYKTKTVDCYRRSAKGSDRYIFDFYAYGYLGVKAGIEGELTVSFVGLKQLFRAGIGIEVGAYADLYGYLHYHAEERRVFKDIDTNGRHYQSLEGGMYFESGIYLELSAFVGVGKKEYGVSKEFKFALLEAGDKYLYVESCENNDVTVVFNENESNTVSFNGLIPAEGKFMDITTGEIETRVIPSKNVKLISDTNLFRIDNQNDLIVANTEKIALRLPYGIPSGTLTLYYKGPNILFSSAYLDENVPELKGFKELCKVTVVYVPRDTVLDDTSDFGKEVSVTYKVRYGDTEETVKTDKIIAGQYYKGGIPSEIISYCHMNGLLTEVDGTTVSYDGLGEGKHIVTHDSTFTFKTAVAQRFIAVKYRSEENYNSKPDVWTVDIMALGYYELPSFSESQTYTPSNVYYQYYVVTPDGNRTVMGNEYLSKYDLDMRGTSGFETGVVLDSVEGTEEELSVVFDQMKEGNGSLALYSEFFTYTLEIEYVTGIHKVYFYSPDGSCGQENVKYGETFKVPNYWVTNINQSISERLVGWDVDADGKVDLLPDEQFTVTKDMILRPVMTALGYTITIVDFDGNSTQYTVAAGDDVPKAIDDIINSAPSTPSAPNEGSFYTENYWRIITSDFVVGDKGTAYFKGVDWRYEQDITKMPACDIVLKGVKGELYHNVTITDATGGYFEKTDEDGNEQTLTTIVIAVKDGGLVGMSKDYQNVRYVAPYEGEGAVSNVMFVNDSGEMLDSYGTAITAPETYNVKRFVVRKDTYTVRFEYRLYDEYGKVIATEIKHEAKYVYKTDYEALCARYDAEYEYYRSQEYYDTLNTPEYTYSSYDRGFDMKRYESAADMYGVVSTYYCVTVCKARKVYKVTEILNDANYIDQETVHNYHYDEVFICPDKTFYKTINSDDGTGIHFHYFAGYDTDGDGKVDILPGEMFAVTSDITLRRIWTCEYEQLCGKS